MTERNMQKAALRGEPSYLWREGQQRRLEMIVEVAGERLQGKILENGCGVGMYVEHLAHYGGCIIGLEYDFERAVEARIHSARIINAACETLPFPSSALRQAQDGALRQGFDRLNPAAQGGVFDLILSHEVLEHVRDDAQAVREMVRVLKPRGRIVLFVPNRGYPFETHGIYWKGRYYFGNKPFVNYLPRKWRDKLAPHVKVYSKRNLEKLFADLPVKFVERRIIFGAYDNLIARFGLLGKMLRGILQFLERTPLKGLGLSHFWVIEKV
jgi:SAM-dependent methyltransferase